MSLGHNILAESAGWIVVGQAAMTFPRHDVIPVSTHICIEGLLALQ